MKKLILLLSLALSSAGLASDGSRADGEIAHTIYESLTSNIVCEIQDATNGTKVFQCTRQGKGFWCSKSINYLNTASYFCTLD